MTIFSHPPLGGVLQRGTGFLSKLPSHCYYSRELKLWCAQEIREVEDIKKVARTEQLKDRKLIRED